MINYPIPDNAILDIIISVVLIFAFLSILVSILLEAYNSKSKARSETLKNSIHHLINDKTGLNYGYLFYNHFMIEGLKGNKSKSVQYISSGMFADVLIDIIANQHQHSQDVDINASSAEKLLKTHSLRVDGTTEVFRALSQGTTNSSLMLRFQNALELMKPGPLSQHLKTFNEKADGDYTKLKQLIENWYNDYMDRVTGWFKIEQRNKLLIAGFVVAIALNVDSIHLIRTLSFDPNLRTRLVATAETVSDNYNGLSDSLKKDSMALEQLVVKLNSDTTNDTSLRKKTLTAILKVNKDKSGIDEAHQQRVDSVLDVLSDLNIPIGWSNDVPPLSYFDSLNVNKITDCKKIKACAKKRHDGLGQYLNYRNNCFTFLNVLLWLLGITITAYSLSFGAPFWFDLLVKLVNLRRAGKKPQKN